MLFRKYFYTGTYVVANEWLGRLNDHSKVLQEKILLKI